MRLARLETLLQTVNCTSRTGGISETLRVPGAPCRTGDVIIPVLLLAIVLACPYRIYRSCITTKQSLQHPLKSAAHKP